MIIVIRNEEKLSLKTNFILQLIRKNSNEKILCVFRRESEKLIEKWGIEEIQLPFSTSALILYYLLIFLKSPRDIYKRFLFRLSHRKYKHVLTEKGFLSMLLQTFYLRFGSWARDSKVFQFIIKKNLPKIFLIDEFLSLNCLDLKKIKYMGPVIYVSQDIAYNRFGFADNLVTRKLMFRLEKDAIKNVDLIIACSEMEQLKYFEMGAKRVIYYPNVYPTNEFSPIRKDQLPSISIVLREHWGSIAKQSLKTIFNALRQIDRQLRVYLIGIKPHKIPKNIILQHFEFIPNKSDYLRLLSKSWIGINVGIHNAGTNERKYDYAQSGTVVLSDNLGSRGDLLPNEYTYIDSQDLSAKIKQLLQFGKTRLEKMGNENRNHVILFANQKRKNILTRLNEIINKTKR